MKIVIVGTSNSVMGRKGFIQALALEHEVIQISSGRTPFYCCLKNIIKNKGVIEKSDILIIDHYVNDVNFYSEKIGDKYEKRLDSFYEYLSTLNVEIINILFPIWNIENEQGFNSYKKTISLCEKFNISTIDINTLKIPKHLYKDKLHLNHDSSYALGLALNQGFHQTKWAKPYDGACFRTPFSLLTINEICTPEDKCESFKNSLVQLDFLRVEKEIEIKNSLEKSLIAIGFLLEENKNLSAVSVNGKCYGLSGKGYFMEAIDNEEKGNIRLSPFKGHAELKNLMGRGISKGKFSYLNLVELMFYDEKINSLYRPAIRKKQKINIDTFLPIALRLSEINKQNAPLKIDSKSIDRLRDLAIKQEKTDLVIARDLMLLASSLRPDGPFIKKKLAEYKSELESRNNKATSL